MAGINVRLWPWHLVGSLPRCLANGGKQGSKTAGGKIKRWQVLFSHEGNRSVKGSRNSDTHNWREDQLSMEWDKLGDGFHFMLQGMRLRWNQCAGNRLRPMLQLYDNDLGLVGANRCDQICVQPVALSWIHSNEMAGLICTLWIMPWENRNSMQGV